MFIYKVILCVIMTSIHEVQLNCIQLETCSQCVLSEIKCNWCASDKKCQPFITKQVAPIICPDQSIFLSLAECPVETIVDNGRDKFQEMLDLLQKMKTQQQNHIIDTSPQNNVVLQRSMTSDSSSPSAATSSKDLKELLHKLMLLKLLRKVKNEGSATLSEEDKKLLSELSLTAISTTTTTTSPPTTKGPITSSKVNKELSQLIEILKNEAEQKEKQVTHEIENEIKLHTNISVPVTEPTALKTPNLKRSTVKPATSTTTMTMTLYEHEENGGVDYVELKPETIRNAHKGSKNVSNHGELQSHYCRLYEESVICNKDSNCTWCNSADACIHRNDESFDTCVHTKRKGYDIDPCFSFKHCKQCVLDSKCYWCDVSKSCHTYPFFGYVPDACGGDWYVKQCDVQLAVIIIVLPLIMILLAMVTFYFCLKYCYYRKKILRVPLFEKPGVFDYRKDKKVYFVHPDDESSDNELEAEKFRKKYRLPVERAPLIDPNT